MKSESILHDRNSTTIFESPNPYEQGYQISQPEWSYSSVIDASAIVHGNKRDPNPHSYTVNQQSRSMLSSGLIRDTSWSDGWDDVAQQPIIRHGKSQFRYFGYSSANFRALPELDLMVEDIYNSAVADLYERIRGSVDLSIDAFQAKKTAQMLNLTDRAINAITTTVPFGRRFKYAGRWFRNKKDVLTVPSLTPKQMGSAWLEWTYGWSPMLSTIHGIAEELVRYDVNKVTRFNVRKSSKVQLVENVEMTSVVTSPFLAKARYDLQAKCRIDAKYELSGHDPAKFTSLNPASIAWELVPYSFVVDWFYDIGSYLRDFESALLYGSEFRGGYITRVHGNTNVASGGTSGVNPDGSSYWDTGGTNTQRYISFNRNLLGGSPFPIKPRLKTSLSSGRMLNAAALLSQFLRR